MKSNIDYDSLAPSTTWTASVTLSDGAVITTGTVNFEIVNVNEGFTLAISNSNLQIDEVSKRNFF